MDQELAFDTKPHLGAHAFPVVTVVAFWSRFGGTDVDPVGLAGGWGRGNIFTIMEEICNQLELYKTKQKKIIIGKQRKYIL